MTDKETLSDNEKIELARQSGYNEACYIQDKKFRGFINDLNQEIDEMYIRGLITHGCADYFKREIIKLAGPELINHSPQIAREQKALKHRPREAPAEMALSEDTQTLCECGHYHNAIYEEGKRGKLKFTDCSFCPCKKFKPQKSCGEDYIGEEGEDLSCGEVGLCSACSGEVKPIILDNNELSIMKYAEEYPENWKKICKELEKGAEDVR